MLVTRYTLGGGIPTTLIVHFISYRVAPRRVAGRTGGRGTRYTYGLLVCIIADEADHAMACVLRAVATMHVWCATCSSSSSGRSPQKEVPPRVGQKQPKKKKLAMMIDHDRGGGSSRNEFFQYARRARKARHGMAWHGACMHAGIKETKPTTGQSDTDDRPIHFGSIQFTFSGISCRRRKTRKEGRKGGGGVMMLWNGPGGPKKNPRVFGFTKSIRERQRERERESPSIILSRQRVEEWTFEAGAASKHVIHQNHPAPK